MESVNCKTEMTKSSTKSRRNEKYEREVKRHGRKNGTITIRLHSLITMQRNKSQKET